MTIRRSATPASRTLFTMVPILLLVSLNTFGQVCPLPTPIFSPSAVPAGEPQPYELNGYQYTPLKPQSFMSLSNIYQIAGVPQLSCIPFQALASLTGAGTFLTIDPESSGADHFMYENGLNAEQESVIVNSWSVSATQPQLPANQQPLLDFDHDAIRLPNGWTAVIGREEELMTNSYQCASFANDYCDVVGAKIVVMDSAGTVHWVWDSFTQFPYLNRQAILGDECSPGPQGCPITLAPVAQDWLHANALSFDPADGNLIVSLRNQAWIAKLAYQNGTGNGSVVWLMGNGGSFTITANTKGNEFPWNDYQHDATLWAPGVIGMFDNGNIRNACCGGQSRGLVYNFDEAALTITRIQDYPVRAFSISSGTAQQLHNGNLWFMGGRFINASGAYSEGFEFVPGRSTPIWTETLPEQYRSVRVNLGHGGFY